MPLESPDDIGVSCLSPVSLRDTRLGDSYEDAMQRALKLRWKYQNYPQISITGLDIGISLPPSFEISD